MKIPNDFNSCAFEYFQKILKTYTTAVIMGNAPVKEVAASSTVEAPAAKPKCKACCACPETKKVRDQW